MNSWTRRAGVRVVVNMAMSADGKIGTSDEIPASFTSMEDRDLLQKIRSRCDALIVGARTAPGYSTMGIPVKYLKGRSARRQDPQPVRVIVSGRLSLADHLSVFEAPISPLVIACHEGAPMKRKKYFSKFARVWVGGESEVDPLKLIKFLHREYGAKKILCEGGPELNDLFFRNQLVNEMYLTVSPVIVGGKKSLTVVEGKGMGSLAQAIHGKWVTYQKGGKEWFLKVKFDSEQR